MKRVFSIVICVNLFSIPQYCFGMNKKDSTVQDDLKEFLKGVLKINEKNDSENNRLTEKTNRAREMFYQKLDKAKEKSEKKKVDSKWFEVLQKSYHKRLAKERGADWNYHLDWRISVPQRLERKEETVYQLLNQVCSKKNKDEVEKIVLASKQKGPLEDAILGLIYDYYTDKTIYVGYAFINSYCLLNKFPKIRNSLFRYRYGNEKFDLFMKKLKKKEYHCFNSKYDGTYTPYDKEPQSVAAILEKMRSPSFGKKMEKKLMKKRQGVKPEALLSFDDDAFARGNAVEDKGETGALKVKDDDPDFLFLLECCSDGIVEDQPLTV